MKLLMKNIANSLPSLYSTEHIPLREKMVVCKFFLGNWTWYAMEFDGQDTFFGFVRGQEGEFGNFSLAELEQVRGPFGKRVERDRHFKPQPIGFLLQDGSQCGI